MEEFKIINGYILRWFHIKYYHFKKKQVILDYFHFGNRDGFVSTYSQAIPHSQYCTNKFKRFILNLLFFHETKIYCSCGKIFYLKK